MKYTSYILLPIIVAAFTMSEISNENKIENLNCTIDSLLLELDTLTWESEIWDNNIENNTTHLLASIMFVESSYNDSAYNVSEDAVGCLQIRQCMVDDVNSNV